MDYLLLMITAIMWSFVGVLVKFASTMVDSSTISLCRFLFGVIFLGILLIVKDKKIIFYWKYKWIWLGVIGKSISYISENLAISIGFAYGNVIVGPVQAVFLAFISVLYFKEEIYFRKIAAVILCILGVLFVNSKGEPISNFMGSGSLITGLFVITAIGAGIHTISQKKLIQQMDSANMNFSVFLLSTFITVIPVPYTFNYTGNFSYLAIFSLIALGFITGISFYINAKVLKRVPLLVATLLSNSSALFTLLWAWLIFDEPINIYIVTGALIFIAGIILLSIPRKDKISKSVTDVQQL